MEKYRSAPRKRRTRGHVIADQAVNHVERFVLECGFTAERVEGDYGYDLLVFTFDEDGYIEAGNISVQLKATDSLSRTRGGVSFRIDIRDYNLWSESALPVFLVVYDAIERVGYWLYVQNYFESDPARRPGKRAKSVTVALPVTNVGGESFVRYAQGRKASVLQQITRTVVHHE